MGSNERSRGACKFPYTSASLQFGSVGVLSQALALLAMKLNVDERRTLARKDPPEHLRGHDMMMMHHLESRASLRFDLNMPVPVLSCSLRRLSSSAVYRPHRMLFSYFACSSLLLSSCSQQSCRCNLFSWEPNRYRDQPLHRLAIRSNV